MEIELDKRGVAAEYRLVYFAPDPDNGERVCIALLFDQEQGRTLFYDKKFSRIRCLSKRFDQDLLDFYCGSLKADFREPELSIEQVLRNHGPQFSSSQPRQFRRPLTSEVIEQLIARFVLHSSPEEEIHLAERKKWRRHFADGLADLVTRISPSADERLIRNASVTQILGKQSVPIRRVALAVEQQNKFILIDGVDLNQLWPQEAIRSANEVVHTFWQYKQLGQQQAFARTITRIGVILNGNGSATRKQSDAHDFIADQFRREADGVVDGSSPARDAEFARLLAS